MCHVLSFTQLNWQTSVDATFLKIRTSRWCHNSSIQSGKRRTIIKNRQIGVTDGGEWAGRSKERRLTDPYLLSREWWCDNGQKAADSVSYQGIPTFLQRIDIDILLTESCWRVSLWKQHVNVAKKHMHTAVQTDITVSNPVISIYKLFLSVCLLVTVVLRSYENNLGK